MSTPAKRQSEPRLRVVNVGPTRAFPTKEGNVRLVKGASIDLPKDLAEELLKFGYVVPVEVLHPGTLAGKKAK